MRFEVHRSSGLPSGLSSATEALVPVYDFRTFGSADEHDARLAPQFGRWLDRGSEHGTWSGGIVRRLDDRVAHVIDLPDLEALVALTLVFGTVGVSVRERGLPRLEIEDC